MARDQATVWPPVGSGALAAPPWAAPLLGAAAARRLGHLELALALLSGRMRTIAAALARRALLAAGWMLAVARRRPTRERRAGALPALRRWHVLLGAVLGTKALQAGLRALHSLIWGGEERRERQRLQAILKTAVDYTEWSQAAVALDELNARSGCGGCGRPRQARQQALLGRRADMLAAMRQRGDRFALCAALRLDYMRQAGPCTNNSLLEAAGRCPVVPEAVQRYIDEVKASLHYIATCQELALDDRLAFLRELRHAYGRTGLVLSGGGSLGFWHFGVVKALLESNLLPRVVSGSSAGSIGSSLLCTHTDAEVRELVSEFPTTPGLDFFAHNNTGQHMRHLIRSGYIQDHDFFQGRLRRLLGDLTFLDAYQRSGRILNISVTAHDTQEPSRLLNYLTAPNVLIWSAVACSSAFPFLFAPQDLLAKDGRGNIVKFSETGAAQSQRRWADGSLEEDLPMRGLSQTFGCNFFITSQCNPYVVPIVAAMSCLPRWLSKMVESEFKHRCQQLLKIWPNSRLMKLLCQPWEGDINMCLPFSALPLSKSTVNFTPADILVAMQLGQRAVWAKLPAIQAACAIEVAIDEQLAKVTRQARQQARLEKAAVQRQALARGIRASLPSWLHMPSLGLPPVESALSLAAAEGGITPSASNSSLAAAAAEGPLPSLEHRHAAALAAAASPAKPARAASRLRRASCGAASAASSREGSQHGGVLAGAALAAAAGRQVEQAAADAGVQATVARLLVANIEEAAAALPELEAPGTPTPREEGEEGAAAPGVSGMAVAAAPSRAGSGFSRAASGMSRAGSTGVSRTVSPEPGAAPSAPQPPPFESVKAAWTDLALLGTIAAAGRELNLGLDVFEY
ncbi:hypothetical protein ABPG75_011406 [Micractinium tetrahymenae]